MKNTIISIGKFEKSTIKPAFDDYLRRMRGVALKELDFKKSKNMAPKLVKKLEGDLILKNLGKNSLLIALDEHGKQYKSLDFAKLLADLSLNGNSEVDFVIGGAYGLSDEVLDRADKVISLGKMTFVHMMVRLMLIEQIYRANLINAGHPYHKE